MRAPEGFVLDRDGRDVLVARQDSLDDLRRLGLGRALRFEELVRAAPVGSGRGRTARIEVSPGRRWVLKRMRRGGLLRVFWRERFRGTGRLLANLTTPIEAERRGIRTARPVALLVRGGPPGLHRAWMATEEIEGAEDLRARFSADPSRPRAEMPVVLAFVRGMHDAGIDHRDLNLGNLLIHEDERGPRVFVVDLDRALLTRTPVSFARRQRALRRLERSWAKTLGRDGPAGEPDIVSWHAWYAGQDAQLARRLARGRAAGRIWLALHRAGWKGKS